MQRVMDHVIMFDESFDNHHNNVRNFLERYRKNKISLNREKFKFAEDDVDFAGYSINSEGITADKKKIKALSEFKNSEVYY